jgi:hypothetical protein
MTDPQQATCATCPCFWTMPEDEAEEAGIAAAGQLPGQCRIDPPQFTSGNGSSIGYWPTVDGNSGWCTKHPKRKRWA